MQCKLGEGPKTSNVFFFKAGGVDPKAYILAKFVNRKKIIQNRFYLTQGWFTLSFWGVKKEFENQY